MEVRYTWYSWVFLVIAILIQTFNETQRFGILYAALSFIASSSDLLRDTQTTNLEFGFLAGPAFLATYSVFILPMVNASLGPCSGLLAPSEVVRIGHDSRFLSECGPELLRN